MRWLEALLGREIARGTLVGSAFMVLRMALQAAYLVLTARALSAAGYGEFAAVTSIAAIVAPLSGLGTGMVMLKDVSRSPERLSACWALTLRVTVLSGLVFAGILVPFSIAVLPGVEWMLVLAVVAAEVLAAPVIVAAALAFQALGRFGTSHAITVLLYGARLAAAGAVLYWQVQPTPATFAAAHLAATAVGAAAAWAMVHFLLRPRRGAPAGLAGWRSGLPYAASGVIGLISSEIDKPLLLRLAGAEAAGVYGAAFRLVSAATAPVGALVLAAAPAFFREAHADPVRTVRALAAAIGYSVVAAALVASLAWVAPLLLGEAFRASSEVMQWLTAWLVFNAARQIGSAALTTRGHQKVRLALEGAGAAASAVLNLTLIPVLGIAGAAVAMTLADATVGLAAWWYLLARRDRPRDADAV